MHVFIVICWLCAVAVGIYGDSSYVEAFLKQKQNFAKKKYRPIYHITAPDGWITSPAGITYFKRQYHLFYQYHPYRGDWGHISWGHAVSKNLIDWVYYPPALMPSDYYDRHGCLGGSAVVNKNFLTLFYTGNAITDNTTYQTQNVAISGDGTIFQKYLYNPIIRESPRVAGEFRNPKVWRFRNFWYMIVGTSSIMEHGKLLLYTSADMFNWRYNGTLVESYGDMGYMWESPDLFPIDNHHVLLLSVQGIETDGIRFRNLYQNGYIIGNFNYGKSQFEDLEVSLATFHQLDHGHDFYGAKTILSTDGRRILFAWLGMRESDVIESSFGWAGMLTIPRELRLNDQGRLLMTPIREMTDIRDEMLENAWYSPGESFRAGTKSFELVINTSAFFSDTIITFEWTSGSFTIGYAVSYGYVSIDRGGIDGLRKAYWSPEGNVNFRIFVDFSSIEVFCGDGEVVFSSRIYPRNMRVKIDGNSQLHITQYRLRRSVRFDRSLADMLKRNLMDSSIKSDSFYRYQT